MKKNTNRFLQSTLLLGALTASTFGAQIIQVSAATVPAHGDTYRSHTADYTVNLRPMLGGTQITPHGGAYTITQTEEYDIRGKATAVQGTPVRVPHTEFSNVKIQEDGTYTIKQTTRVPGYYLEDQTYQYVLPLVTGGKLSSTQVIDFQPKLQQVFGDIRVHKTDDDDKPLAGVSFKLTKTSEAFTNKKGISETVGTLTTDDTGAVVFEHLPEGTYELQETNAPTGYNLDNRVIKFDVTVDNTQKNITVNETTNILEDNGTFINYRQADTDIKVSTINSIDPKVYYDAPQIADVNGKVNYQFEVSIPKDMDRYDFLDVFVNIDNRMTLDTSSVQVKLFDAQGGVKSSTGTFTPTYENGNIHMKLKSPAPGQTPAKMVVTYSTTVNTDSSVLPEASIPNKVDVSWDNGLGGTGTVTDSVNITVKEGALQVKKLNQSDGGFLQGTEFKLYRIVDTIDSVDDLESIEYDDKLYFEAKNPRTGAEYRAKTDSNGEILFEHLPHGDYLLVETEATDGYRLMSQHLPFTITDVTGEVDGVEDSIIIEVDGYKQSEVFPGTGTAGLIFTITTAVTAGGAALFLQGKKKEEE